MSPRPPRTRRRKETAPKASESATRAMVLVDEMPIRREMLREHQRAEDLSAQLRERLERHESADLPAYGRWEARALGPLLTAIRELEGAISRKRSILEAVEDEQFFTGCTELTAYRRVMKRLSGGPVEDDDADAAEPLFGDEGESAGGEKAEGTHPFEGPRMFGESDLPPGFDADDFDLLSPARQREFREQYAIMSALYEEATGMQAPDLDDLLRASRKKNRSARAEKERGSAGGRARQMPESEAPPEEGRDLGKEREASRIKELYRALVRKLHPDLNPKQGPREAELWHAVQDAYGRRDLEGLEAAAARADLANAEKAALLPIFLLRRVIEDLHRAIRALKSRLGEARKHPAWNFTEKTQELPRYESRQRQRLEQHRHSLEGYMATLAAQLDRLAARAEKPRREARKPKRR